MMPLIIREEAPTLNAPATGAKVQCDWFKNTNTTNHRTNEYDNDALVLRRGETFKLAMTFEGVSFSEVMKTTLGFTIESSAGSVKSIQNRCSIVEDIDQSKWEMEVVEKDASRLYMVVKVNIPPNAIVGRYLVDVIIPSTNESLHRHKLIVLFNPWCKADEVYLNNKEERKEYVLNETGTIYQGNAYHETYGIHPKKWNYGQFEKNILDCVLLLLEKDKRSKKNPLRTLLKRSSSLFVARILSAMINSQDDNGVVVGIWPWTAKDGHVSPSSWNGSVGILQQYYNNHTPVRYGQCWVYAGVMTTALRALGIPARAVTNFDSAHDTDQTMTIDVLFDENKKQIPHQDSIWNFHVWNEIWSARKDLPGTKYDGWQVVDATPQERSFGIFQVGPAPVTAIKEGEIYAGFDTGFVFAEVNAEYVEWLVTKKTNEYGWPIKTLMSTHSRRVGKYISTKKVGMDEREDVTHLYKYKEGSAEERKSFSTAYSFGYGPITDPGFFDIEEPGKGLMLYTAVDPSGTITNGSNFTCLINLENTSHEPITVDVSLSLNSVEYFKDEIKDLIKSQDFENVSVPVGGNVKLKLPVTVQDYIHKLTELNSMKMTAVATVKETKKVFVDYLRFNVKNVDRITIQLPNGGLRVGEKSEVKVSLNNNLPISLSNLVFTIEGAGLTPPIQERGDVLTSGGTMTKVFSITPYKSGPRTFIVDVDSKEVKDFKSFLNVNVQDANVHA